MEESAGRTIEMLMREADWLRALARRLVDDPERADDLVHRTRVAAFRRPPAGVGPFRGWLSRVATNLVRQDLREATRRDRRERATARSQAEPSPAELVVKVELQRTVARAVVSLDEPYRTTLLLRYYEDLPVKEIARRMQAPARTVETRLRRGLERLRHGLDEAHDGDRERWFSSAMLLAGRPGATGTAVATKLVAVVAAVLVVGVTVVCLGSFSDRGRAASDPRAPAAVEARSAQGGPAGAHSDERTVAIVGAVDGAAEPPTPPAGGTGLRGRIIGPDGRPAGGARVRIDPTLVGSAPGATTRTDEDGRYLVTGLPPGATVRLRATTVSGRCGERTGIEVVRGRVTEAPDVPLARGATLRGMVRDDVGLPVVGAAVTVGHSTLESPIETDRAGRFDAGALLPGRYPITVTAAGFALDGEHEVELLEDDAVELELVLGRASPITGRVVDETGAPVPGAVVRSGGRSSGLTGADGGFRVEVLAGSHTLFVARPGFARLRREGVVTGGASLVLTLKRLGEIRGVAISASDGAPVKLEAADVYWKIPLGKDRPFEWVMDVAAEALGEDGSFRIPLEYGTGQFQVEARAVGYALSRSEPFEHDAGDQTAGVVVRMVRGIELDVSVRSGSAGDAMRDPVAGATVVAHEVDPNGNGTRTGMGVPDDERGRPKPARRGSTSGLGRPLARGTTDDYGVARLEGLPAGALSIVVTKPGFAPGRVDGVAPATDESPTSVDVVLEDGGTIAGNVIDARGASQPGLLVLATGSEGARGESVTGPDGRYRIEHLAPGRYAVTAEVVRLYEDEVVSEFFALGLPSADPRSAAERFPVVVEAGATASFDVVVDSPRVGALRGSVSINGVLTSDVFVRAERAEGGEPAGALAAERGTRRTGAGGTFEFRRLEPGTYALTLSGPESWRMSAGSAVVHADEESFVPIAVEVESLLAEDER